MKGNGTYSDLKVAWLPDRLADLREDGRCVPAQIQMILSDLCNHNCSFCAYRWEGYDSNQLFGEATANGVNNNPNRKMPTEKAKEILQDAANMGVLAIQFTGGGEPTVHPDHMEIFRFALNLGLKCGLVTNGCRLREGWDEVLPRFDWIRVSMDAGTADTYSKIREVKPSVYTKMLANVRFLSEKCADTAISASFIVTNDNWHEITHATENALLAGAESIRFGAVFNPDDSDYYCEGVLDGSRAAIDSAQALYGDRIVLIDMLGQRVQDMGGRPNYSRCWYQHLNPYIGADLHVYRCCNTAYNKRGQIANLATMGFRQAWKIISENGVMSKFNAKSCTRCAFNGKNLTVAGLIDRPRHAEFV